MMVGWCPPPPLRGKRIRKKPAVMGFPGPPSYGGECPQPLIAGGCRPTPTEGRGLERSPPEMAAEKIE